MKRIIVLLLIIFSFSMALFFTSCSNKNTKEPDPPIIVDPDDPVVPQDPDNPDNPDNPDDPSEIDYLKDVVVNNAVFEYDGQYHLVDVENVPDYATVLYTPKNGYKNAGEYTINISISYTNQSKDIHQVKDFSAQLTINKAQLTVYAQEKIITKGSIPSFDYTIIGYKGNDNINSIDVLPQPNQYVGKDVGVYENEIKFTSAEAKNYEFNYISADLIIKDVDMPIVSDGYVLFGRYPQTLVGDESIVDELENKINSGFLIADSTNGYYPLNGNFYAKVIASPYNSSICSNEFSNGEKITNGKTYYFNVEPIKWKILTDTEKAYLTTDLLLDIYHYQATRFISDDPTYLANDYTISDIRYFLNNDFIECVFGSNNDLLNAISITSNGNNVIDKIAIMNKNDVEGKGPNNFKFSDNSSRQSKTSDYCKAKGAFTDTDGNGYWWLNEPSGVGNFNSCRVAIVRADGDISYDYWDVNNTTCSIRPIIKIDIN